MTDDYFRRYLEIAPTTLALVRAIECRILSAIEFKPPILDIGCGDGVFAAQFFEHQLDEGMDLDPKQVERAAKTGKYKIVRVADAKKLPYPDNSFNTVFSNCVFEHIPGIESVLKEVNRVLRPGGRLIITVPSDKYGDNLLFTNIFRGFGLSGLGKWYTDKVNSMSFHVNLFGPDVWKEKLGHAGLTNMKAIPYLSPEATRLHDLMMLPGYFALKNRQYSQKMILMKGLRTKVFVPILHSVFERFYLVDSDCGSSLIIIAEKP